MPVARIANANARKTLDFLFLLVEAEINLYFSPWDCRDSPSAISRKPSQLPFTRQGLCARKKENKDRDEFPVQISLVPCPDQSCSLSRSVLFPVQISLVPCPDQSCSLSRSVLFPVQISLVPCPDQSCSLSRSVLFPVQISLVPCPDQSCSLSRSVLFPVQISLGLLCIIVLRSSH